MDYLNQYYPVPRKCIHDMHYDDDNKEFNWTKKTFSPEKMRTTIDILS